MEGNNDFFANAPFYVSTDGLLFIVKDKSLVERDMTEEERLLYRSDDFERQMFSTQGSTRKRDAKGTLISGPKEKGVVIQVKKA